jgi:hypothetical protein
VCRWAKEKGAGEEALRENMISRYVEQSPTRC